MNRLRAWLRVPLLLMRFPTILLSVVGAGILLAVATSASPLFLASAGTAAVQSDAGAVRGRVPAFTVSDYSSPEPDLIAYRERLLVGPLERGGLGNPVRSIVGVQVELTRSGHSVRLASVPLFRQAAVAHLSPVGRASAAPGVWVPQSIAKSLAVGVGDGLSVFSGSSKVTIRIGGIYRDLADQPRAAYWAPLAGLIYRPTPGVAAGNPDVPPPPPFLIMDQASLLSMLQRLRGSAQFRWDFPLGPSTLTLPTLQRLSSVIARTQSDLLDPSTQLGSAFPGTSYSSPVSDWLTGAQETVGAITGPVEALSLAARIVALFVVAAAGVYAVHRRRVEFDLLDARGIGPVRLGVRSSIEAAIPAAVGAVVGWALTVVAVKAFGPSRVIPTGTAEDAFRQAALAAGVGIVLLGVGSGTAAKGRSEARPGRMRGAASRLRWEWIVLGLAAASFYEILTRGGGTVAQPGGPPKVDRLLLLFPILLVAGGGGLAVRGLRRALPRLRAARTGSPSVYLAARRLASAPRMALLLVTASALAVGMLTYGGMLSTSIQTTANDKALLSTGSDVAVTLGGRASPVPGIASTPVERVQAVTLGPGGPQAEVLAIDRATFTQAAFWNDSIMGASVADVMRALAPSRSDRLPVVLVGPKDPGLRTVVVPESGSIPVRVVSSLKAFPGVRPGTRLVAADVTSFFRAAQANGLTLFPVHELWAKGDPAAVARALRSRIPITLLTTADEAKKTPTFLALSWTFGYLEALGVAAGLVALLAMVLYLQARQRDREVAYALARRMGLSSSAHRRSVAGELAGMFLAAFVIGGGLAVLASALVFGKLDPLPALPPGPVLRFPVGLFASAAGALLVASAVGAWAVQRRADRANVAEVMRLAG